jgi:hypothetical protein
VSGASGETDLSATSLPVDGHGASLCLFSFSDFFHQSFVVFWENQLRWGLFCERIYSETTTITNVSLTNSLPILSLHGLCLTRQKFLLRTKGCHPQRGQNSARCPGSGADNLNSYCFSELLNFFVSKAPPDVLFPISQPYRP